MIRRSSIAAACTAAAGALVAAGSACSSSTNSAAPADAGAESSTTGSGAEAGAGAEATTSAPTTYSLQWEVVLGVGPAADSGTTTDAAPADAAAVSTADDGGDDGGGSAGSIPIPGAQVCVYQNSAIPCTTTAADGTFTLAGLPGGANLAVTVNKAGYVPTMLAISTARTDMDARSNPIFLNSTSAPTPGLDITMDWANTGQVIAFAIGPAPDGGNSYPGDPGATVAMSPMSGSGPFYENAQGQYVPTATSFLDFFATYFNVAPGMYTLTYTDPRNDCEGIAFPFGGWGYPGPQGSHSITFPVVAGYSTGIVGVLCTPSQAIVAVDAN